MVPSSHTPQAPPMSRSCACAEVAFYLRFLREANGNRIRGFTQARTGSGERWAFPSQGVGLGH